MAFNTLGVSLSFFLNVKNDPRYREGMTVRDVSYEIVKPDTLAKKCAFYEAWVDKSDEKEHPYVAPASVFVSYAREYDYEVVLEVLLEKDDGNPNAYYWFDLFICSQHGGEEKTFEWWQTTFQQAIINIGTVYIVMAPWNSPAVIRRVWCLWEIFCTIKAGKAVQFEICLPASQSLSLFEGIADNFNIILDTLLGLDARNAEAAQASDKAMIFAAIENDVGFDVLNNMVKDQLREWYVETGANIANLLLQEGGEATESDYFSDFLYKLGSAFIGFGDNDRAIFFLEAGLKIESSLNGEENAGSYYNNLGNAYEKKGEYDRAIDYYERSLKIKVATLGKNHASVASNYTNLGNVYDCKGEYDRAINFYERSLKVKVATLGENHTSVANNYNNLGIVYKNKGDYDRAIKFYERSLKIKVATLGENHPDVATSYNNLGSSYHCKGEYDRAIDFYERSLKIRVAALGNKHYDVAANYSNLGEAFHKKKEFGKALDYHTRSYTICLASLGGSHPNTARSHDHLALTYHALGEYPTAMDQCLKGLKVRIDALGENHADTATSYNTMGKIYLAQGDNEQSRLNFKQCIIIRLKVLGKKHPKTVEAVKELQMLHDSAPAASKGCKCVIV